MHMPHEGLESYVKLLNHGRETCEKEGNTATLQAKGSKGLLKSNVDACQEHQFAKSFLKVVC